MNLLDLEMSLHRYLYENLELTQNIKIQQDINKVDYDSFDQWVVVDSLTNRLGPNPKQLWFLHCAVKQGQKNEKIILTQLVDSVLSLFDSGDGALRIPAYSYSTGNVIGELEVTSCSLSPVLPHKGGGAMRSMTLEMVYAG